MQEKIKFRHSEIGLKVKKTGQWKAPKKKSHTVGVAINSDNKHFR